MLGVFFEYVFMQMSPDNGFSEKYVVKSSTGYYWSTESLRRREKPPKAKTLKSINRLKIWLIASENGNSKKCVVRLSAGYYLRTESFPVAKKVNAHISKTDRGT